MTEEGRGGGVVVSGGGGGREAVGTGTGTRVGTETGEEKEEGVVLSCDLNVKKQHRCSYTGGRLIGSRVNNPWYLSLNNGDISCVSIRTGEIIMNITVNGEITQRGAPLSRVMTNRVSHDEIITFDLSLNDEWLIFVTKQNRINVVQLIFDKEFHEYMLPMGCKIIRHFPTMMESPIRYLLLDNTATMVVGGAGNGEIRIWNIESGLVTHKYIGHSLPITCLRFHPDMTRMELYSGSADASIRVWHLKKDRLVLLNQLQKLQQKLRTLERETVTKNNQESWDNKKTSLTKQIERAKFLHDQYSYKCMSGTHHSAIVSMCFLNTKESNKDVIISIAMEDVLCVWDCNSYECLAVIPQFSSFTSVSSLLCPKVWFNSGLRNLLLITDESGSVHECYLKELKESREIMSLDPQETTEIPNSAMTTKRNKYTLIKRQSLQLSNAALMHVQFSPNLNEYITNETKKSTNKNLTYQYLVGSSDFNVYVMDHSITLDKDNSTITFHMDCEKIFLGHNDHILDIVQIPCKGKEEIICMATNSSELRVMDLQTFNTKLLYSHSDTIMSVAVHATSGIVATASKDNTVRFWKRENGLIFKCIGIGEGHTEAVNCVASGNDKKHCWFISGGTDKSVRIWEIDTEQVKKQKGPVHLKCSKAVFLHPNEVMSVDVSSDSQMAASSGIDGTLVLYHVESKSKVGNPRWLKQIKVTTPKGRSIWCVKFSPFQRILATCHNNGDIRIWSLEAYNPKLHQKTDQDELSDPLMSTTVDNTGVLQCLNILQSDKNDGSALKLCFVNHGLQILSSHGNGLIKLWTLRTRECNGVYRQHYDRVWSIVILEKRIPESYEKNKDSEIDRESLWFLTGGTDAILNVWRDDTRDKERIKMEEKHAWTTKQTEIKNLIRDNKFGKAVQLCIDMDQPQRLLQLLLDIVEGKKDHVNDKIEILREIVTCLNPYQLGALITLINDWNTNSKYCMVSQYVLYVIFKTYDLNDLCQLSVSHLHRRGRVKSRDEILNLEVPEVMSGNIRQQSFAEIISSLYAYSKRHYQRIDNLTKHCYLLDYMLACMAGSSSVSNLNEKIKMDVDNKNIDGHKAILDKEQTASHNNGNTVHPVYTIEDITRLKQGAPNSHRDENIISFLEGLEIETNPIQTNPVLVEDADDELELEDLEETAGNGARLMGMMEDDEDSNHPYKVYERKRPNKQGDNEFSPPKKRQKINAVVNE